MYPVFLALFVAAVLVLFGLYAFSGADLIRRLPLIKTGLLIVGSIYFLRGVAGNLSSGPPARNETSAGSPRGPVFDGIPVARFDVLGGNWTQMEVSWFENNAPDRP